jgi:hypothetical protein
VVEIEGQTASRQPPPTLILKSSKTVAGLDFGHFLISPQVIEPEVPPSIESQAQSQGRCPKVSDGNVLSGSKDVGAFEDVAAIKQVIYVYRPSLTASDELPLFKESDG